MENNTTPPPTGNTHLSPETKERIKHIVMNLPKDESGWPMPLYLYQGFWSRLGFIEGDILTHQYFKAQPSDILVCSPMKCGTTWLKALTFAVVTRHRYDSSTTSPLLRKVPHECMPPLLALVVKDEVREPGLPLISTHAPYHGLPESARVSGGCKIVYMCRDPKDAFVSMFHFFAKRFPDRQIPIEQAFDLFCQGKSMYGPFWDHVFGYWKASQERPEDVMFLRYEDVKKDTASNVKRMAEFMGYPFSPDEEKQGAVRDIVELCSFEKMSNLDVNKNGIYLPKLAGIENKMFFRKGDVGDWKNWLTPEMAQRLDNIMEEKLRGSGLTFHN